MELIVKLFSTDRISIYIKDRFALVKNYFADIFGLA